MSAERTFPAIVAKRTVLRPYVSERDPMAGETMNWSVLHAWSAEPRLHPYLRVTHENSEPIRPPEST